MLYIKKVIDNGNECKIYYKDKQCLIKHREDGPALECSSGRREWWINGNLHREDGPAIEWANGSKHWFKHGKRHREDGPAYESYTGLKEYYLDDKVYFPTFFWKRVDVIKRFRGFI